MDTVRQRKWDLRFLRLAAHVAEWSKDPSTKTGAVIVDDDLRIVSLGFNGLPRGIADTGERLHDRALKYQLIVHCERNAILFARGSVRGCTLYTYPFMSCSTCAAELIQVGIKRHVAPRYEGGRWDASFALSIALLNEAKIPLTFYTLEEIHEREEAESASIS